jgi:hypothetical protein
VEKEIKKLMKRLNKQKTKKNKIGFSFLEEKEKR